MTQYQKSILEDIKNGAKLQSTEGENYKCWLVYPNGNTKTVRRDSAEKVCNDNERFLVFGGLDGIRWRKR